MPKTVLIAADDPHIAYLLQRYAERSGFVSVRTSPAASVLNSAQTMQPALIILELESLQGQSETLLRLKADVLTSAIPVIVYTCCGQEPRDQIPRVAGYLRESVLYDEFVATLHDIGVQP